MSRSIHLATILWLCGCTPEHSKPFEPVGWAAWADGHLHAHLEDDSGNGALGLRVGDVVVWQTIREYLGKDERIVVGFSTDPLIDSIRLEMNARPAQVEIINQRLRVIGQLVVEDQIRRQAGEPCTWRMGIDACDAGTVCTTAMFNCPAGQPGPRCTERAGRCEPVEIVAYARDDGLRVRLTGRHMGVGSFNLPGYVMRLGNGGPEQFDLWFEGPPTDTIDLYDGYNLVAASVPVLPRTIRALGEACTPDDFAEVCAAGLQCQDERCVTAQPPVIESVTVQSTAAAVGLRFTGQDANRDAYIAEVRNGGETLFEMPFRGERGLHDIFARSIRSLDSDDRFSVEMAWLAMPRDPVVPLTGTLVLRDWQGQQSASVAFDTVTDFRAPFVEIGEACDVAGIWSQCAAGASCVGLPTSDLTCEAVQSDCPAGLAHPLRLNQTQRAHGADLTSEQADQIEARWSRCGGVDSHRLYTFVAPEAARYRFELVVGHTTERAYASLSVRASCIHGLSELSCGQTNADRSATAEVTLMANQRVTVKVSDVADFAVSVQRL